MHAIHKYPIPVEDYFDIDMPAHATILTVQTQRIGQGGLAREVPCIWAKVDPANPPHPRKFRLAGTGHPIEESVGHYVGTFQLSGGELVFHLFEVVG